MYSLNSAIHYYNHYNSPVYSCFLDASKAFDRVNHWSLFNKLINRSVPDALVRILLLWYNNQTMCIKWESETSEYFNVTNGVRQGGILSPYLFSVYMDDLSGILSKSKVGCFIDNVCFNHVFYADDICLLAPSPTGLQKLITASEQYSIDTSIRFNPLKSVCIVFKPPKFKLYVPPVYLNNEMLSYNDCTTYLGFKLNSDMTDDSEIKRQLRLLYCRSNSLIRMFSKCTDSVKIQLFKSYCSCFYSPYLWTQYKQSTFSSLRVGYNNALRRLLRLPARCSASTMFVSNNVQSIHLIIRRLTFSFMNRISISTNTLIRCLHNCLLNRVHSWKKWHETLHI